jgi:HK97 family phage major capsid protein
MRELAEVESKENRSLTCRRRVQNSRPSKPKLPMLIGASVAPRRLLRPSVQPRRSSTGTATAPSKSARKFSLRKAIVATLPADLGGGIDAGFEREISQEVVRRSGRPFQGLAVPDEVFMERRTLLAGSTAIELIPPVHLAGQFIDRLRARIVAARLGATYLDGLVGTPIDIPRQTGSSTAQWLAEDGSLTEDDASFDDVTLTPKTVGAMTSYSRRTLLNSSPGIEGIIRSDLAAVIANVVDQKAMLGDGTANTPVGIVNAGASVVPMTSVTWANVLDFEGFIDEANALDGTLGWAMNPHVKTKLRSRH